jgi:tetratricopeptide (TPR) repeat protein
MRIVKPLIFTAFAALAIFSQGGASAALPLDHAVRAHELIEGLDLDEARNELSQASVDDLDAAIEKARLAIYEEDCDGAVAILKRPELAASDEGRTLNEIAQGCARVTAATVVEKDAARNLEVRFQDEADRALMPMLADTVVKARDALTRDLGVTWPTPTRVVVVRDLLSLSAMTGLPYESATTTGTVAVAKWGRVTLLTPRASHHGFVWRDTMAHELTHLAVTRATNDRAPLWLQEGVAKREEIRWRDPGPFDNRPSPESIVVRGMEMKIDVPLDKLGPSIAMLPTADQAMVAFAEVTSFVRFFADHAPPDGLPHLLTAIRDKKRGDEKEVDDALREVSQADLKQWDAKWRAWIASSHHDALSAVVGLSAAPPNARDVRERMRLAELLDARGHAAEALKELDKAPDPPAEDPSFSALRASVLHHVGRDKDAEPLVSDPKKPYGSYGPWWAIRGQLAVARGDQATADASFAEAVATDPFDIDAACGTRDLTAKVPDDPSLHLLCEAARQRAEPPDGD